RCSFLQKPRSRIPTRRNGLLCTVVVGQNCFSSYPSPSVCRLVPVGLLRLKVQQCLKQALEARSASVADQCCPVALYQSGAMQRVVDEAPASPSALPAAALLMSRLEFSSVPTRCPDLPEICCAKGSWRDQYPRCTEPFAEYSPQTPWA